MVCGEIMKTIIFYVFTFNLLVGYTHAHSALHTFCSTLFGSQKANEAQRYITAAQDICNVKNMDIPVQYINNCPLLNSFCSFSWTGIWINKAWWCQASENARKYVAAHEVAHHTLKHPLKLFLSSILTILGSAYLGGKIGSLVKNKIGGGPWIKEIIRALLTGCAARLLIPLYVRITEISADQHAAQSLVHAHQEDVVQEHIRMLQEHLGDGEEELSPWFNTYQDQIENLAYIIDREKILAACYHIFSDGV
jgi:Zn-dependent protease with chaperone function